MNRSPPKSALKNKSNSKIDKNDFKPKRCYSTQKLGNVQSEKEPLHTEVLELRIENTKLQHKVSELEALLAAAYDEIEERDQALLEIFNKYEALHKKSATSSNKTKEKDSKASNDKDISRSHS